MPDRESEAGESNTPGPFMTLRTGGPFEGTVTVTITTAADRGLRVEAEWRVNGDRRTAVVRCDQLHEARTLAHNWAALLGMGREPPR